MNVCFDDDCYGNNILFRLSEIFYFTVQIYFFHLRAPVMPIFVKKFSPKLPKPRETRLNSVPKLTEDIEDFKNIKLKLNDDKELRFVDGVWLSMNKNQPEGIDDVARLQKAKQKLEEENHMLQVKMDVLLDLLTESMSEKDLKNKK